MKETPISLLLKWTSPLPVICGLVVMGAPISGAFGVGLLLLIIGMLMFGVGRLAQQ